jgi:hypothetical protein
MTEVPLKEKRKVSHYYWCESLEGRKESFVLRPVSSRKKIYKNHKRNMPQLQKVVVTYRHYAIIVYVPYQDRVKTT